MKAGYQKPTIVFEDFELNAAIAAACDSVIHLGPGDATHPVCREYEEGGQLKVNPEISVMGEVKGDGVTFYEGSCTCYLSSVGSVLITS